MSEPGRVDAAAVGEALRRRTEAAAARFGMPLHRATDEALQPDDYDSDLAAIAEARSRGLAEVRQVIWQRCIPARFQWASVDDFDATVAAELTDWAHGPPGRNLLLLGPVGVGKSHAAVAAARLRFARGDEVRFMPVVELLDMLRPGGPEGALYDLADIELLVLDDIGSERPTEWTAERLYSIVNRRWLEERSTIVTANLAPSALEEAVGARVYSRLVGNGSVGVALSGHDRRRDTGPRGG